MSKDRIFRYFKMPLEIIRLAVMKYSLKLSVFRKVEDLLHERGIRITHETVRTPVIKWTTRRRGSPD